VDGKGRRKYKGFFYFSLPGVTKAQMNVRKLINEILRRKTLPFKF
jgi:hypothetical protein